MASQLGTVTSITAHRSPTVILVGSTGPAYRAELRFRRQLTQQNSTGCAELIALIAASFPPAHLGLVSRRDRVSHWTWGAITKLTAMRFARGMFRLWLVLSCLWIATVAMIGYSTWPSSTPSTEQATSKDPKAYDPKTYVPEYMKNEDPNAYVPEFMKDDHPNNAFADFAKPGTSRFAQALKDFDAVKAQQSAQHLAVIITALAFVPPALILLVGLSLTWAFRGFRPS